MSFAIRHSNNCYISHNVQMLVVRKVGRATKENTVLMVIHQPLYISDHTHHDKHDYYVFVSHVMLLSNHLM